jgi:hypothetical protein
MPDLRTVIGRPCSRDGDCERARRNLSTQNSSTQAELISVAGARNVLQPFGANFYNDQSALSLNLILEYLFKMLEK